MIESWNSVALLLLCLFACVAALGSIMVACVVFSLRHSARHSHVTRNTSSRSSHSTDADTGLCRPTQWLAIRNPDFDAVRSLFHLSHMKCCSWSDALCSGNEHSLFIGPPVDGWVIIFGDGLPDFREDIDAFYKFLMHISAAVGHVQFFCIDGILHHHAWVRLEAGRVIRAYAWAGQVLWIQGRHTPLEAELGLHCWDYDERAPLEMSETAAANVERIPRLAACWSFDPGLVDRVALNRQPGIAGGCSFPRWH